MLNNIQAVALLPASPCTKINTVNNYGQAALHKACYNNNMQAVELLLACPSTNVNAVNNYGQTALHKACWKKVVALLLSLPSINVMPGPAVAILPSCPQLGGAIVKH